MELVGSSIDTHIYAICILVGIIIFNLYSVITIDKFFLLHKRLKTMTPYFHGFNFVVAYTGGIVSAFKHTLSPMVIVMVIATIFVMILEIKRYKKMRVIKLAQTELQDQFRKFAKKIYLIELSTLIVVFLVSFLFRQYY